MLLLIRKRGVPHLKEGICKLRPEGSGEVIIKCRGERLGSRHMKYLMQSLEGEKGPGKLELISEGSSANRGFPICSSLSFAAN